MARTHLSLILAAAIGLLCGPGWSTLGAGPTPLGADPVDPFLDTDDDFLPDSVEWTVVTSPQRGDTDFDGISDFVEVVQHGNPRGPNGLVAQDHEMRLAITSTPATQSPG